jgi:parvulin-like peptidyl-prolyl isomerase
MRAVVVVALGFVLAAAGPAAAQAAPLTQPQAPPAAAAAQPAQPDGRIEILEQILVKVNGEILTKTELESRQVAALRQRGQQMSDDHLRRAIADVTPELLVDAVDEMLMLQRGKELGYKVSDEQFKRVLENIRKENKLENDDQFYAALKQEGLDLGTLRRNIERQMVLNQVQQVEIMSKLGLTEDEAKAYFAAHKNEFTTPAQITLRELMISVPTDGKSVNVGLDEETKRRTEAARARALKGEPFEQLVAELSDSPSKSSGGLVGPLSETDLDPSIRKLLATLKDGDVTEVFRTSRGWAILKLERATKADVQTFEQARDAIAEKVIQGKRRAEFLKYIHKLRSQAIIDWKNVEMKKIWEERTAADAKTITGVS